MRALLAAVGLLSAEAVFAQHDISKVDPAPASGAISTPIPNRRGMKKYDIPDLAGAEQALGSQLIDGRLRKPLIDFLMNEGAVAQRVSLFEGGLVIVNMTGAATIFKRMLIPPDALEGYTKTTNAASLARVDGRGLPSPVMNRRAQLRVYTEDGKYVERVFHPGSVLPKTLNDQIAPLRDLLLAVSEDRSVTSTVAGYEPKAGDELVADDQKVYRVMRVIDLVVELRCLDAPATIYVARKDLNLYFIGRRAQQE